MVDALYDLDPGLPVFPYVGPGAGGQALDYRDSMPASSGNTPLIPTEAGVREPPNRRVEIILS